MENITVDVVNNKAITIFVSRKVSVKQFESVEVSAHLPVDLPVRTADDTEASYKAAIAAVMQEGINLVKVQVYDALGLEYSDDKGIIREKVAAAFASAPAPKAPSPRPSTTAPSSSSPSDGSACPDCGGAMWDNRQGKTNPKAPDWKCKDKACGKAVWLKK